MTLATWNIGLEEQLTFERTPSIIRMIHQKNSDILCLQDVWRGPQILRQIYQAVKDIYPHFEVVNDDIRDYITLYTNSKCWACLFDRFITVNDPLGFNYCRAINLPELISSSSSIISNLAEAPWDHSIGLIILVKEQYPLKKLAPSLYSKFFILPRGYIIVSYES
ncbi:unnamed protein product [Rotaria magnacalcarata]|uniref:Endonuclease/exonuclease/phosphatase domain-containing protein n=1 Tax=Rotaria magnacalcarata TaxID=392030 RepID=A0A814K8G6_9BILA|nr:unnamed protein product [Rotaria magnacalcarata]